MIPSLHCGWTVFSKMLYTFIRASAPQRCSWPVSSRCYILYILLQLARFRQDAIPVQSVLGNGEGCGWTVFSMMLYLSAIRALALICCSWAVFSMMLYHYAQSKNSGKCCGWPVFFMMLYPEIFLGTVKLWLRLDRFLQNAIPQKVLVVFDELLQLAYFLQNAIPETPSRA